MPSSFTRLGLPKELADEIDALVGPRKRSLFVCEAVREKLHQDERMESIRKSLAPCFGSFQSNRKLSKARRGSR